MISVVKCKNISECNRMFNCYDRYVRMCECDKYYE